MAVAVSEHEVLLLGIANLRKQLAEALPSIEAETALLDRENGFPEQAFSQLRAIDALVAPLPVGLGGLGMGTEPAGASALQDMLRHLGRTSLSVARLYEGHVNALKLIAVYGTEVQLTTAAADARAGHLFGIWVTDASEAVRMQERDGVVRLAGSKRFVSGALHVTRPLITAKPKNELEQMIIIPLGHERKASDTLGGVHGMRAACTGICDLSGIELSPAALIGAPGDYLRQPSFSAGAWRGIAVTLGGIDSLVGHLSAQLRARERDNNPHQLVRIGEALIARETAAMWTSRACDAAEGTGTDPSEIVAVVGLARLAVEAAGLDVIRLVQRGLGLAAFLNTNPVERIMRDLATYLRQPAPDETLTEAAAWFSAREQGGL